MDRLKKNWPILLLLIVTVIPVWKAVFAGEAIGPWDHIRHFAPFNGPKPETPWDVLQADGALQFYAWRDLVFESWRHGEVPVWNPYQLGGAPLMGNSQSGALYPPHILMGVLRVPTPLAMGLLAWFHLFWAGLGVYVLTRRLGASQIGAAIGGVAFGLSPFMLAWTALPSVPTTVSWMPWALWAVVWAKDALGKKYPKGEEWRQSLVILVLGMIFGSVIWAGHLQFAAYTAMGVIAFTLASAFGRHSQVSEDAGPGWKRFFPVIIAIFGLLIGVGFAYSQTLQVLRNSQSSHRKNVPTEEGYQAYLGGALKPAMIGQQLVPNVNGLPTEFADKEGGLSQYWPGMAFRGANYAEAAMGQGPWIWGLAIVGAMALWRKRQFGFAAIGLLGVLLAFGTPLNRLLYFLVPGWSGSGSPGRAGVLIVLALACLAAFSWEELVGEAKKPRMIAAIAGLAAFAIGILSSIQGGSAPEGIDANAFATYVRTSMQSQLPMALLGIALTIGLIYFSPKLKDRAGYAVIGAVALAGLLGWGFVVRTGEPIHQGEVQFDPGKRYAFVNEPWDLLQAAPALMPPNLATIMRVQDAAGYDSLMDKDVVARMNDMNGQDSAPLANGNIMFVKPNFDPQKLSEMGVTEVWSRIPLKQMGEPFETANGYAKYRLDGPGLAYTPQGPATIEWLTPNQVRITAQGPGLLVTRFPHGAWTSDKFEMTRPRNKQDNGYENWVAIKLPEGKHDVVLYQSSANLLNAISILWLVMLGAFLASWIRWKRNKNVVSTPVPMEPR
ncbi:MAG: hypothetical protein KF784_10800 [Fimbriimonadaceae bacterium]|nr:hypothetical protein [Fimbriimonadaceae bacterium]